MKVVLISGKARHGKDTAAIFLKEELEADGYNVLIAHYGDLVKYICRTFFDWDGQKDERGRTLLQMVGTDEIRVNDPNYWVDFVIGVLKFFPDRWDYVIIPDCRFPNEIDRVRDAGFDTVHIRVVRDGFRSSLTPQQLAHPSETSLDNVVPDYFIHNDGLASDLRHKISDWLVEFNGYHQTTIKGV